MLTIGEYVRQSLETNLFFLRIVKEHILFAAASLVQRDAGMIPPLMQMKDSFETLLMETVTLAKGVVTPRALAAGDLITPYTLNAENATQFLTGLPINTAITQAEAGLHNQPAAAVAGTLQQAVTGLNRRIISMLNAAIQTKKAMAAQVLACKMFTFTYPLMMNHIIREEEHYLEHLHTLENHQSLMDGPKTKAGTEVFWNEIMGDHGKFIRGMLDPTEEELIQKANGFALEFGELTRAARQAYDQLALLPGVTRRSIRATEEIRNFKAQGTEGILACRIRSVILPLLSDHVLREANHYLKELRE